MTDILKFLYTIYPPLCYIALGGAIVYFVSKWYNKKVKKKFENLPCENHKDIIEKLPCNDHTKSLSEISNNVFYLIGLTEAKQTRKRPLLGSQSPLNLTDEGKVEMGLMGAYGIVENNWGKIYKNIEDNIEGKNLYDIQEYCLMTSTVEPESFYSPEDIDKMKLYAFKKGFDLFSYLRAIGVIIRDKYFAIKGLNKDEIDIHDPTNTGAIEE